MGLFNFFKKKPAPKSEVLDRPPMAVEYLDNYSPAIKMAEAARYFEMFQESVDLISKTVYCKTFFYRYGFALENARKVDDYLKGMDCNSFGVTDVWDQPTLPKEKRHTSILANPDYDYPTTTIWRGRNRDSQVQCCIQDFSHERFDFIRDEIQEIITQII